ncbi:vacuolar protein sorting/targeting protein PEP1 [Saitoella coloradoensis]
MQRHRLLELITLLALVVFSGVLADKPKVHRTTFDNLPANYFYFNDSPVLLYHDPITGVVYRSDNEGKTFDPVKGVKEGEARDLIQHPFDNEKAFILSTGTEHWRTENQGKSWQSFTTPHPPTNMGAPIAFSATKGNYAIFTGIKCESGIFGSCQDVAFYTKDAFDTDPKPLLSNVIQCAFAQASKHFKEGDPQTVFCVRPDPDSKDLFPDNLQLVKSSDWFQTTEDVSFEGSRAVRGVVGIVVVEKFLVAAVKSSGTDEMRMYVSLDGNLWDRAEFPHDSKLQEDAYTVLESMPYSIQVDVLGNNAINPMGTLYTSNSNGTYFVKRLEHTNRNVGGNVDFEKVDNVEGVVLANVVANWEEVQERRMTTKKVQSRISFDDGNNWHRLKGPGCDGKSEDECSLHLHSVTSPHNSGRIFSSTAAPGILMGVGNVGPEMKEYTEGDLFVSTDAGLTWSLSRSGAHKYEFGDGGSILIAVDDEESTDRVAYSLDFGRTWKEVDLDGKVKARMLTTVPDSTSRKFTLLATGARGEKDEGKTLVVFVDFANLDEREKKCKLDEKDEGKSDFEKWYARTVDGQPQCLMGHKEFFWRKKVDRGCFVGDKYADPVPVEENCPCTDADYECDYNFARGDNGECVPATGAPDLIRSGQCTKPGDKYMGISGYRLIPGNTCDKSKGVTKDEPVERTCGEMHVPSGKVGHHQTEFNGEVKQYYYLERSETSSGNDETVILRTTKNEVWRTHDQGGKWDRILVDQEVISIVPHPYFKDYVYFLTVSKKLFVSKDRAKTILEIETPLPPNGFGVQVLQFHPVHSDWIIYTGGKNCEDVFGDNCHAVAYYSKDGGFSWDKIAQYVRTCSWARGKKFVVDDDLVICEKYSSESGAQESMTARDLQLISSNDYFEKDKNVHFKQMVGFAPVEEYIVVAELDEESKALTMHVTVDGKNYAKAHFPPKFKIDHQQAYTVMDSVTDSIFLHVTTNPRTGSEWGSIMKSNSNGTYYVMSEEKVNRDSYGYVDFEKMQGLEGVAVINVVTNADDALAGANKKLRTKATHNDGGEWNFIAPPKKDSEGKSFCSGLLEKCSLNLHGYTERKDFRDTLSSGSAVGLMLGVGNVGEYLTGYGDGNTFITRDGGVTWKEAHKGTHMWEYGDQGSIIVIVNDREPTNKVLYTLNEGESWEEYVFANEDAKVKVTDIATVPSDTSRRFLLFGKSTHSDKVLAIQLDFTGLTDRQCNLDPENAADDDFELWTPMHPESENGCLFGHKAQYHRKLTDHLCYIGSKIPQPHKILDNCTCTRQDFECDFNYQRASDGSCVLVDGATPPDHSLVCAQAGVVEWFEPTGYRRIPMTTCQGGKELDKFIAHACPGKEREFERERGKKGLHGFGLFVLILMPFLAAGGVAWYVYARWQARYGQIRLGDEGVRVGDSPAVRYPIIAVSALAAVVMTVPALLKALGGAVAGMISRNKRFTTRDSFARGGYSTLGRASLDDDILGDSDGEA